MYFAYPNLYMIKGKPQNIEVVLLGNTLHRANVNGINGTFFDTPRPTLPQSCWGLAVNEGKPIGPNAYLTHWKGTKRGTVAWNGNKMICQRINHYREIPDMIWGISGVMLLPDYNRWAEKYLSDVYRRTNHTVIGFNRDDVYLMVQKNCTMTQLIKTCKKFGLEGAVSLDGGGSSQLRFNGKGLTSSRRINSAVVLKG
ncbi:MAG: phosphodiester glycosidase family protein [Lutispora sp.]|nr:phosphodiester glycosidase family protein [Lutispora sp.]MDD4835338.1 phosphodiester glycosidase family protein [Lutispora sp.]